LNMGSDASIVSRGNLISQVQLGGSLTGTIAAVGNIGTLSVGAGDAVHRLGGITTGKGHHNGQVISLGNIEGNITIAGDFDGQIADASSITGNIRINGAITRSGDVISGGSIGDKEFGTTLSVDQIRGSVVADGAVNYAHNRSGGSPNVGASPAAYTLWQGTTSGFDSGPGEQDLATLAALKQKLMLISKAA
jgi:hypothetical protein